MGNTISYTKTPVDLPLGPKGTIRGLQFDTKSRRYAGIPYALPPTGSHRWRKPRPLPPNHTYSSNPNTPYDATQFKPICPQKAYHVGGSAEGGNGAYSEDCLFVNIWTPVPDPSSPDKKWPVMLWLHGGWFQMGDPSQEAGMDPTELIATGKLDAIVVAIGYRLNVFGFLAGPDLLEDEDENGISAGNFGLWDQRLAAEWVYENIGLFGGDRENITLAGRSAGAYSVEAQMLYEFRGDGAGERTGGRALYRRFFMDSNAIPAQPKSLRDAKEQFDELCSYFNIDLGSSSAEKLAKLRQKTPQELVAAIPNLKNHTFRPVTDDLFIHQGMAEYLASKEFASEFKTRKARLLIGEVLNEETLYSTYNSPTEPTVEALRTQIGNYYAPDVTERALQCYKLPESKDLDEWKKLFGQIISDGQVRAPSRALVSNLVSNGVDLADIWRYQIAYRLSFINEKVAPMSFGVAHAMDKPFWNFSICYGPTSGERKLMEDWIENLVAFVNDKQEFEFGTKTAQEMKVVTPEGRIEVRSDERWEELLRIGEMFAQ
ncbi:Carboxylic ester hydrolase [Aspergillus mulundensis]|uniref:Carboxylic ester hydrolase n=1 Tax=Aspergillus mulundensis TaxID=1810919 RepID=A0A3D8T4A8_9EURO|nr:Carboxylic ester hydrolase [Aspergillus mulundensis]RDW93370.1 Carboxylic ester hydrolase [Aspergillus mulundensis]